MMDIFHLFKVFSQYLHPLIQIHTFKTHPYANKKHPPKYDRIAGGNHSYGPSIFPAHFYKRIRQTSPHAHSTPRHNFTYMLTQLTQPCEQQCAQQCMSACINKSRRKVKKNGHAISHPAQGMDNTLKKSSNLRARLASQS